VRSDERVSARACEREMRERDEGEGEGEGEGTKGRATWGAWTWAARACRRGTRPSATAHTHSEEAIDGRGTTNDKGGEEAL